LYTLSRTQMYTCLIHSHQHSAWHSSQFLSYWHRRSIVRKIEARTHFGISLSFFPRSHATAIVNTSASVVTIRSPLSFSDFAYNFLELPSASGGVVVLTMEELPSELLHIVFFNSGPKATACGMAVNKKWNAVCQNELLWKAFIVARPELCYGIDIKKSSIQHIIKWPEGIQPSWKELIRNRNEGNHPNPLGYSTPPPKISWQLALSSPNDYEEKRKRTLVKPPEREFLLRFVVIGSFGAGKSSLADRFALEKFAPNKLRTIGVEVVSRLYTFPGREFCHHVQIWDTAGQGSSFSFYQSFFVPHSLPQKERFRSVVRSYYRNMHGIVVAFDLNSIAEGRSIYAELDGWREEIVVLSSLPLHRRDKS